jgi:hypothetical protein
MTDGRRRLDAWTHERGDEETRRCSDAQAQRNSKSLDKSRTVFLSQHRRLFLSLLLLASLAFACSTGEKQSGIQPEAQATIDAVTRDMSEERYDKIYNEAAAEWRQHATLEQSNTTFSTLKTKLGNVKGRTLLTGKQQQNTNNGTTGNSLVLRFNTTFERGEGMETFTLLERDGRWLLAGYSVNSNALK